MRSCSTGRSHERQSPGKFCRPCLLKSVMGGTPADSESHALRGFARCQSTSLAPQHAELLGGGFKVGAQAKGLLQMVGGLLVQAEFAKGQGEVEMHFRNLGPQDQRSLEQLGGFVILAIL